MRPNREYALLSDKELVERLTAIPPEVELQEYFVCERCKNFLKYIACTLYDSNDSTELLGELYEFLSKDNWNLLKSWKNKNGASLYSYIAHCSINHFTRKKVEEKKRNDREFIPSTPEIFEQLNAFTDEEEQEKVPVWEAFRMLRERDREVLRHLIIDDKKMLDAAPVIWGHLNSKYKLEELPPKKVQSIIAMAKHRALLALVENVKKLTRN